MKQGFYLAFVYIGLVIGAGFASGREIMEYFNIPSGTDHSGIVLATFLLIAVCYVILSRAYQMSITNCDEYLRSVAGRAARPIRLFMLLYMFCGFFTMLAGSGALLSQNYMLPPLLGVLLLAVLCFFILSFDLKGIIAANGILVPCMLFGILYICVSAALFGTRPTFSFRGLTRGMLTSSLCYVSYNTLAAAPVLIPLQKGITPRGIRIAAVCGGFTLGLLILIIWASQALHFDLLWESELPMLNLAAITGRLEKQIYTLILLMAICTTAISQGFGILEFFQMTGRRARSSAAALLCLCAIPFSLFGFSNLVAHLYAFFGIAGLLWTLWIFIDFFFRKKS